MCLLVQVKCGNNKVQAKLVSVVALYKSVLVLCMKYLPTYEFITETWPKSPRTSYYILLTIRKIINETCLCPLYQIHPKQVFKEVDQLKFQFIILNDKTIVCLGFYFEEKRVKTGSHGSNQICIQMSIKISFILVISCNMRISS